MDNMILASQENHTETLLHHINMLQATTLVPNALKPHTTLNFKYKVDESIPDTINTSQVAPIAFYGIGIGGADPSGGLVRPHKPKHTDMDLYTPIPFRILGPNEGLLPLEQELYRLPVQKVFDGITYTCYMLKCLRVFKTTVDVNSINSAGVETAYELSAEHLNPTPDPSYQTINVTGLTTHSMASVDLNYLTILPEEIADISQFYFNGIDANVNLNEWGLYSGYDNSNKAYNIQLALKYCNAGTTFPVEEGTVGYSRNIKLAYGNKLYV